MDFKIPRMKGLFNRFRGRHVEFSLKPYRKLLSRIDRYGAHMRAMEDERLQASSVRLMTRARDGTTLDDLLVESFALVREAARRVLGLRPFDVQIMAGIAMHQGKLVEMQTGEGKTLVAVLPAYLNALTGLGVHILTFNDYLARRDADWMGPVYAFLGLSVGFVQEGMSVGERQKAYASDITYVTAREAGFDFLRDHLCPDTNDLVHRAFNFAVVDEADSNLIDEARVPLVIAGSSMRSDTRSRDMAGIVRGLKPDIDFAKGEHSRNVHLTEAGLDRVEAALGCGNLHEQKNLGLLSELNLALHAEVLLKRDADYIVRKGKIELVNEFTGRLVKGQRWPDGLQAAVEAKEGIQRTTEGTILGSITLQHFLRLYPKISGMTATAQPAAEQFKEFYDLSMVVMPPHRPCIRIDCPDVVFTHKQAKTKALVDEITKVHATGRPILIGTGSVRESEQLASAIGQAGVACQVLNAKDDALEAEIIAEAGSLGAVTISTNMAGRGTDIRLGGHQQDGRDKAVALGGLYVIGTNRHESRRIDDQLRGRAGRQGDPGGSRFFISLADDLISRFGVEDLIPPEHRLQRQDDPIDDPVVAREIERTQRIMEDQNGQMRRTLWEYSSLIEEQRKVIHRRRQDILLGHSDLHLLATEVPDRYSKLCAAVGEEVLQRVERQITLFHIDRCWASHLDRIAHTREGIHLFSVGGQDPLNEFHKMIADAFDNLLHTIDEGIIQTFVAADITTDGIDLASEGLKGPSATWTYLVNDNPFGDWLERFFKGIRDAVRDVRTK